MKAIEEKNPLESDASVRSRLESMDKDTLREYLKILNKNYDGVHPVLVSRLLPFVLADNELLERLDKQYENLQSDAWDVLMAIGDPIGVGKSSQNREQLDSIESDKSET
eukprot:CAMPEP_0113298366 /NCGR_PEP_ID=MMETSP0010_2-20120614/843_1 /TAXON_ID=216773 ORGANISM="Corethron hystrix, Strain 308" /NCGR_SAMPLE_ID=MMETSP0010_2 /ASSEMBLY_ACC=CAM_ASM_000155 /LENGTH=108 /DNA_ID=CAMNT_0000151413 /DNA_START=281 /DNA_END=607 /DNA_ORIENTATION=- /assembly_acc=CAM_ASM_000155